MAQRNYEIFHLGDWELQSGEKILDAHLAYRTFGDPGSPAIVYPTWFSGGTLPSGTAERPDTIRGAALTGNTVQQSPTTFGWWGRTRR